MRYAVLSDIHGNLPALDATLQFLDGQRIDRYLCLGDVVGYGAEPIACWGRLEQRKSLIVAGNHEAGCTGKLPLGWFNRGARAAIEWTREQLGFVELNELRRLPLTAEDGPLTLVHGSLRHPEQFEYLVDLGQALETLHACRTLICLVGHTHVPFFVEFDRPARRVLRVVTDAAGLASVAYHDEPDRLRYLLNPGSVGQPRDGDARASCAIVDADARTLSVHRVPYDVAAAQAKIRHAGLPDFLAERLAVGR